MRYQVSILRRAQKSLADLPGKDYQRVRDSIRNLGEEPRPSGCSKLSGRSGWRIRIGNYRVIYEIDDQERVVTVLDVGYRRDIYR